MKVNIHLPLTIIFLLAIGCTSKTTDSTSQQDTSRVEDGNNDNAETENKTEDEGGGAFDPVATANHEAEAQLNNFLQEFETNKSNLLKLAYAVQNELDGTTITYYYNGKSLIYVQQTTSAEGGYEEKFIIKVDKDTKTIISYANNPSGQSDYNQQGYFSITRNGEVAAYSINSKNDQWTVSGKTDIKQINYDDPAGHMDVVRKNKAEFALTDGVGSYVFYTERKKVTGEYGEVEVTKSYQVDKDLFEMPGVF